MTKPKPPTRLKCPNSPCRIRNVPGLIKYRCISPSILYYNTIKTRCQINGTVLSLHGQSRVSFVFSSNPGAYRIFSYRSQYLTGLCTCHFLYTISEELSHSPAPAYVRGAY